MNDTTTAAPVVAADTAPRGMSQALWVVLPLLALVLAGAWVLASNMLDAFEAGAPPVEKLTFERTILDGDGIHLKVRAGGSGPITIAQVQVDDAYWSFRQEPQGALDRLSTAWLHIPYPWVLAEAHAVKVLTRTGVVFTHEIEVALATPQASATHLTPQALLGTFVGIVPVIIGMLFYPAIRGLGRSGLNFILALTVGLLAFLAIDTLKEAIELGTKTADSFQGVTLVLVVALAAFLVLLAIGRRHGTPTGLALAFYIALGIGLHNFGEGLAIGGAYAAGIAGLGTFLVLGFTLHNVTEGIGIVAPLAKSPPSLPVFAGLGLLAGAPAIPGIWLGSLSYSPHWSALALAVGAGAIAQVIVEVGAYMMRSSDRPGGWLAPATLSGFVLGLAVMYVTAILVKV
jgi:zinc transporter ZupT